MVKVLLIYPDVRGDLRVRPAGYFYNGIACISALLKQYDHEVRLLHYLTEPSRERFDADLLADRPDLIAYSSTTNLFGLVRKWSGWARQRLAEVPQVCGGVHATLNRDTSLLTSELDAVCVGEGEWAMVELCDRLEGGHWLDNGIANMAYKDERGRVRANPVRRAMSGEGLDVMPYADRSLFDDAKICDPNRPIVMASRGCPYSCSYCCNRALRDLLGNGQAVRLRSVDNVIGEIKHLQRTLPSVDGIHFDDDIFGLKLDWLRDFAGAYRVRVGLPFSCNVRPNLATEEVVQLLAEAGCDQVAMGVEAGNPELRKELLNRSMDDELLVRAFGRFEQAGIIAHSYNMVGLPHETMANSLETVKLNAKLKRRWRMDELRVTIFYPYPGTALYGEARRCDMLTGKNVVHYADDTTLKLKTISPAQIRFVARYFRILVVVYQKLLRNGGNPAGLIGRLLDRFLLSKPAEKAIFPVANGIYPLVVKAVRWLRLYDKPGAA